MAYSGLPTPRRQRSAGIVRGIATIANGIVAGLINRRERERQARQDQIESAREERRLKMEEALAQARIENLTREESSEDKAREERIAELKKETALLNAEVANARAKAASTKDENEAQRLLNDAKRLENEATRLQLESDSLELQREEFEESKGKGPELDRIERDRMRLVKALDETEIGAFRGVDSIMQARLSALGPRATDSEIEQEIALMIGMADESSPLAGGNYMVGSGLTGSVTLESLRQDVSENSEINLNILQSIISDTSVSDAFFRRYDRDPDYYRFGTPSASTE